MIKITAIFAGAMSDLAVGEGVGNTMSPKTAGESVIVGSVIGVGSMTAVGSVAVAVGFGELKGVNEGI